MFPTGQLQCRLSVICTWGCLLPRGKPLIPLGLERWQRVVRRTQRARSLGSNPASAVNQPGDPG